MISSIDTSSVKPPPSRLKKGLVFFLKIIITIVCFWYISQKIAWHQATQAFSNANGWYLLLAVLLYFLSKVFSSIRLNLYLKSISLHLSERINGKLYWMGMFYNLFLPGAISGDAYKVILLHRRFQAPVKKVSAVVLIDRFSGLLALGVLLSIYAFIVLPHIGWKALFIIGAVISIAALYLIIRRFFSYFTSSFWPTFLWGLAVQAVQVVCLYALLAAIGQPILPEWIFISLVATVISVLPISLGGGLGTRELVFAEGATFFSLDPAMGVVISLLFYGCNLVTSVWGIYYVFRDPLEKQ